MTTVVLSPERAGRITGSRIAKVLGLSPYGDAESVMREMVRSHFGDPEEFLGNWATDRGQDGEDKALTAYESRYSVMVHGGQKFIRHPDVDWLGVTIDGLVHDAGVLEAKYPPPRARYTRVDERPDYDAQIRLQLECAQRDWGDLAVYKDDYDVDAPIDDRRLFVSRVDYDPAWLPSKLDVLERFHDRYLKVIASEMLAAPYRSALRVDRDDVEFADAEMDYADALAALRAAELEVTERKGRLVALSAGKTTRGRWFQVTHSSKAGNVDWPAFAKAEAPNAEPEKYRKPRSKVVSINPVGSKK